jgi:catechol 2,3-dioxygenase-like lactoylglutathione lyase family enzyme
MASLIQHFDHFVVPADDLVAVEEFYLSVFGCKVATDASGRAMRFGLTVRQRKGNMPPHTFFEIAGKRIGIFLQSEERPKPRAVYGAPSYVLEATETGIERMVTELTARGVAHDFPGTDAAFPHRSLLAFNDPAGNHFEVFVRPPDAAGPASPDGRVTAISHLRLEAPQLDASARFYSDIFGLEESRRLVNTKLNAREATLALPSGQLLILSELPFSPKGLTLTRTEGGPHIAFYVPYEYWEPLCRRLSKHGIAHGDRYAELREREARDRDTYVEDPAGYVVQLVSEQS